MASPNFDCETTLIMATSRQQKIRIFGNSLPLVPVGLALAIVFLLTVVAAQAQVLTVLHDFTGGSDGSSPYASLTMDAAGSLYGTTSGGGIGFGTVFKLKRAGSGWIFTYLYLFQGGSDGAAPGARVIFGPDGSLYGTTYNGGGTGCGGAGCGTVFNLKPQVTACKSALCPWTETVLYRFSGSTDGALPGAEVIFDGAGNLYGTTLEGGVGNCTATGCGLVYKLTPTNGVWTESVLYSFNGGNDGALPLAEVIFDGAGHLYGTTEQGGSNNCFGLGCGTVFTLAHFGSGWVENILYTFQGDDGYDRVAGLTFDEVGNLYGATYQGGGGQGGTIFKLTPSGGGGWTFTLLQGLVGDGGPAATLTEHNGNLCGTTFADGVHRAGSVFCSFELDFDDGYPRSRVVFDSNGNLYGTASEGGAYGKGFVWKITP